MDNRLLKTGLNCWLYRKYPDEHLLEFSLETLMTIVISVYGVCAQLKCSFPTALLKMRLLLEPPDGAAFWEKSTPRGSGGRPAVGAPALPAGGGGAGARLALLGAPAAPGGRRRQQAPSRYVFPAYWAVVEMPDSPCSCFLVPSAASLSANAATLVTKKRE